MATKKKKKVATATAKQKGETGEIATPHDQQYEQLLAQFVEALETFNKGDLAAAKAQFEQVAAFCDDEPVMMDRSRVYARICEQKLAPPAQEPQTAEEQYYLAVLLANEGRVDEALALLDRALLENSSSAKFLYARASVWAIKANVDAAVSDLRQAIAVDPQVRFQATNDPDFEAIREEPAFIDIIEPTPSGA